jgi:hypothetical protein
LQLLLNLLKIIGRLDFGKAVDGNFQRNEEMNDKENHKGDDGEQKPSNLFVKLDHPRF